MIDHSEEIYTLWRKMISACDDRKNIAYPFYGAKNITVCEEWHDFQNFYNWAKCNNYTMDKQLIRKYKNNGFYPGNCILIKNKYNRLITVKDETKTLAEWAKYLSVDITIIKFWSYHGELYTENQIIWLMQNNKKFGIPLLTVYSTALDYISWAHVLDLYRPTVYKWVSLKGKEYAAEKIKYILNHPEGLRNPWNIKKYIKKTNINDKRKKVITVNGETKYLKQWADKIECTPPLISYWIKNFGEGYAIKKISEKLEMREKINTL